MPRRGDGIERRKRGTKAVFVARPCKNGRRFSARTFDTYDEARRYKDDLEREPNPTSRETCEALAGRWLEDWPIIAKGAQRGRPKAQSTLIRQRSDLKRFADDFEGLPLAELLEPLGRAKLRKFVAERPHTARTIRAMFQSALGDGLLAADPLAGVTLPSSQGRREKRTITAEQLQGLAGAALKPSARLGEYGPLFRALILFSAYNGPRFDSVSALMWADVDFVQAEVHYRRAKGGHPYRCAMLPEAVEALSAFPRTLGQPLVFPSPTGLEFKSSAHHAVWDRVRAAAGLHDFDWHELRHWCGHHFYVTLGFSDELAGAQLGHTSGEQIRRTYGHGQQDALQRLKSGIAARSQPNVHPLPRIEEAEA